MSIDQKHRFKNNTKVAAVIAAIIVIAVAGIALEAKKRADHAGEIRNNSAIAVRDDFSHLEGPKVLVERLNYVPQTIRNLASKNDIDLGPTSIIATSLSDVRADEIKKVLAHYDAFESIRWEIADRGLKTFSDEGDFHITSSYRIQGAGTEQKDLVFIVPDIPWIVCRDSLIYITTKQNRSLDALKSQIEAPIMAISDAREGGADSDQIPIVSGPGQDNRFPYGCVNNNGTFVFFSVIRPN